MKTSILLFLAMFSFSSAVSASCGAGSCTPACDSSCSYSACTGTAEFEVNIPQLPTTTPHPPSSYCSFSPETFKNLPFTYKGVHHGSLPTKILKSYGTCQTHVLHGPACPLPVP